MNFAAQKAGKLAADGQSQSGPAIFTAGAGIGLLERFKDDLLLFSRDANTGIADLKRHDRWRRLQHRMLELLAGSRIVDPEADAALGCELESVGEQILQYLLQPLGIREDV